MKTWIDKTLMVSGFAASLVIGIQSLFINNLSFFMSKLSDLEYKILIIILASGTTQLIYKIIVFWYSHIGWKYFYKKYLVEGSWSFKLKDVKDMTNIRNGKFKIIQKMDDIRIINGINYNNKGEEQSYWDSKSVAFDNSDNMVIWVVYEIRREKNKLRYGESRIDNGILRFQLEKYGKKEIKRMVGVYMDAGESKGHGEIEAWKT